MGIQQAVREAMRRGGVTQRALAARLGKTQASVSNALGYRQRGMGVDVAVGMLGALGYDLVAVPKGSKVPSGGIVISESE